MCLSKKMVLKENMCWHISRNVYFLFVPCQILLSVPRPLIWRPKRVLLRPKGVFKRPHRTRPDEDSLCTFY